MSEYEGKYTPVDHECASCGHTWESAVKTADMANYLTRIELKCTMCGRMAGRILGAAKTPAAAGMALSGKEPVRFDDDLMDLGVSVPADEVA